MKIGYFIGFHQKISQTKTNSWAPSDSLGIKYVWLQILSVHFFRIDLSKTSKIAFEEKHLLISLTFLLTRLISFMTIKILHVLNGHFKIMVFETFLAIYFLLILRTQERFTKNLFHLIDFLANVTIQFFNRIKQYFQRRLLWSSRHIIKL